MSKGRITSYEERCPSCKLTQAWSGTEPYCFWCGYDYGKDWETVEVDLETNVIIRTIIPAQPEVQP